MYSTSTYHRAAPVPAYPLQPWCSPWRGRPEGVPRPGGLNTWSATPEPRSTRRWRNVLNPPRRKVSCEQRPLKRGRVGQGVLFACPWPLLSSWARWEERAWRGRRGSTARRLALLEEAVRAVGDCWRRPEHAFREEPAASVALTWRGPASLYSIDYSVISRPATHTIGSKPARRRLSDSAGRPCLCGQPIREALLCITNTIPNSRLIRQPWWRLIRAQGPLRRVLAWAGCWPCPGPGPGWRPHLRSLPSHPGGGMASGVYGGG